MLYRSPGAVRTGERKKAVALPAIGIGLVWIAYAAGLYGYCLMKGYNVSAKELMSPKWPPISRDTDQDASKPKAK
jgi:hypothetical protein